MHTHEGMALWVTVQAVPRKGKLTEGLRLTPRKGLGGCYLVPMVLIARHTFHNTSSTVRKDRNHNFRVK